MQGAFAAKALAAFGVTGQDAPGPRSSRSAAAVHAARTAAGQRVFVKITATGQGPDAMAAARRELRFYQHLAPAAPVRTPRLLSALDDDDGVAILLQAAGTRLPARSWTAAAWAALGSDLAALHTMPCRAWTRPDPLRRAMTDPQLPAIESFWAADLPVLAETLARRDELGQAMDTPGLVFIHGDCHTDNIVHAADGLVFLDWQQAGLGRPSSDLAFVQVRAMPGGVTAPPALTGAYAAAGQAGRRVLDRALVAEELAIYVFVWPSFAALNSPAANERVRQRARVLCSQWAGLA